jgi:CRP-like cAMP-binding protein
VEEPVIDAAKLKTLPLFETLVEEHLEILTRNLRPLHMDAGEVLITERSETRGPLFIVEDGELEVSRADNNGVSHRITVLEPPTVVGELEFLADVRASASVEALTEVGGMLLPRASFQALFAAGEPAAYHLALAIGRMLSKRLADTNTLLVKALSDSPERLARVSSAQFDSEALARIDEELRQLLED